MSEIQTFYPTSGMTDRSPYSIMTAFYNCINGIPEVADFFDSVEIFGDESSIISAVRVEFKKGNAYIQLSFLDSNGRLRFLNNPSSNTNNSNSTDPTYSNDITVKHSVGINGTNVIWLDIFYYGVAMVFNKYGDKYFLANSASSANGNNNGSFYYSDTGGQVGNLAKPFNGSNIGKAAEYIAQPYYHFGINTGDLYTFDGGGDNIPLGKFNLGDSEFIHIFGNFALRIK